VIALDEQGTSGLGVARYVRDPDRPEAAEVTVTVGDDWQRRGVGTVALNVMRERAREEGIRNFIARCWPAIAG
jgi:GNAT superfamily N-acetyltransferase